MGKIRILVIGYGNPGRGDDGLGPALVERLESLHISGLTVESDYQLTVEHAALAAEHDIVVFADAALDADSPFYFRPIAPAEAEKYSSHSLTPGEVLLLSQTCFGVCPEAYALGIRAHSTDQFEEGLTVDAHAGLDAALEYLVGFIAATEVGDVPGI